MAQMTQIDVTRAIVLASTIAAAFVELYLATTPLYPQIFWIALAGAIVTAAAGRRLLSVALPILMFAMYLMPAVYIGSGIRDLFSLEIIWILPLLGLLVSGREVWHWSLPRPWQWPLTAWTLVVSVSWPLVFFRELDFYWGILPLPQVANTSIGIEPWAAGTNVAYFALGHNVGILWLDALYRWYSRERPVALKSQVLVPLAGAAAIACGVSLYQAFVDLSFLNSGFWAYMGRVAGTLGDPNKFGMIAALWAAGIMVVSRSLRPPWPWAVAGGGVSLMIAGVWVSGTRTGLATMMIVIAMAAFEGWQSWRARGERQAVRPSRMAAAAATILALALVVVVALRSSPTTTVVDRGLLDHLPVIGEGSIGTILNDWVWERNGYGPAAIRMVREHPLSGVGVGAFHTLTHDFGKLSGYDIVPDNAQNWVRHMVAELGLLGSIPWIWWCVVFGGQLFSRASGPGAWGLGLESNHLPAGILRGALIGFAVASLFGMAGQSMPVILTFWTFVFWFAMVRGVPPASEVERAGLWRARSAIVTAALVLVHAGLTFADARGDLLPRNRAQRFGWFYRYGLSDVDRDPNGGPGRRWTMSESVAVIEVKGKVLKFAAWIDHPDGDEKPVQVRIWADSKLVYDGDLKRSAAIFLDIPAAPGASHMVLETWMSRTWRPRDYGREDRRELGLSIRDWQWE